MRQGIVLFLTLAVIALVSGMIALLLKTERHITHNARKTALIVQTDALLNDLSEYLLAKKITPEKVYSTAGIPVTLETGNLKGELNVDSAQRTVDINAYLKDLEKKQPAFTAFLRWLNQKECRQPTYLLALLTDTLDKDAFSRAQNSEIRLYDPRFPNGSIPNERSLAMIVEAYRTQTGDTNITLETFTDVFGFDPYPLDLNYATIDQLELLYPGLPHFVLTRLAQHDLYYKSAADLPFDDETKKSLFAPPSGAKVTFKSDVVKVSFSLRDGESCRIEGSFHLHIGGNHFIDHVTLKTPYCPPSTKQGD